MSCALSTEPFQSQQSALIKCWLRIYRFIFLKSSIVGRKNLFFFCWNYEDTIMYIEIHRQQFFGRIKMASLKVGYCCSGEQYGSWTDFNDFRSISLLGCFFCWKNLINALLIKDEILQCRNLICQSKISALDKLSVYNRCFFCCKYHISIPFVDNLCLL